MARVAVTITDELPIQLKWKKATLTITEIADAWRETGRWWQMRRNVPSIS